MRLVPGCGLPDQVHKFFLESWREHMYYYGDDYHYDDECDFYFFSCCCCGPLQPASNLQRTICPAFLLDLLCFRIPVPFKYLAASEVCSSVASIFPLTTQPRMPEHPEHMRIDTHEFLTTETICKKITEDGGNRGP